MKWYTIYNHQTGDVAATGSAQECCQALGTSTLKSFKELVRRCLAGTDGKWVVVVEDIPDSELFKAEKLSQAERAAVQLYESGEKIERAANLAGLTTREALHAVAISRRIARMKGVQPASHNTESRRTCSGCVWGCTGRVCVLPPGLCPKVIGFKKEEEKKNGNHCIRN